jgi:hypothetical protein
MASCSTYDSDALRRLAIATGLAWGVSFVVLGLGYGLQMYGDGSIFSYMAAVQDSWAFHWRNISGRAFVYLFCFVPAETVVALTGSARAGIVVYGLMLFAAPLIGLALTYRIDRSPCRLFFTYACASTAVLCPFVFGFPTEMWMAHAVFWPVLALCHDERGGMARLAFEFVAMVALVLTHEGAVIFAIAIVVTLALRGLSNRLFLRAVGAFVAAMLVWAAVKAAFPPDAYFGGIVWRAALLLIDVRNLTTPFFLLLFAALVGYGVVFVLLGRISPANAHVISAVIAALALAVYWLWFDRFLHTDDRYGARTALLIGTPIFGALAAAYSLLSNDKLRLPIPLLRPALALLANRAAMQAATGALALVTLANAVETAKLVTAWSGYKTAVRALAVGTASDLSLGDPRFVSSAGIDPALDRLAWFSTTPYLSILLAPGFLPNRLVVDSHGGRYFWLSCATATANEKAERAIPVESRRLIRIYSCLHR